MKYQYIRAFIVLLAGFIALIINMKTGKDVTVSLAIVLVVLIVFYFLGTLIVEILQKAMEQKQETNSFEEEEPETEEHDGTETAAEDEEQVEFFDEDDE